MFTKSLYKLAPILPKHIFWDLFSRSFLTDKWQHHLYPQHRWLLGHIKLHQPKTILEAGCGFGRNLIFLTQHGIKSSQLTGVDFSSQLLDQAKVNLPRVKLYRASAQNLPFSKPKFDLSFTHGLLMHIPKPQLALQEIIRVSHKWVIIIEETRHRARRINSFTWAHNYSKLFSSLPVKVMDTHHNKYNISGFLLKKI